jgi:hypothetical protein
MVGIIMWGAGAYFKIILTARTVYGFATILFAWVIMCLFIMLAACLNVRGIYVSYELQAMEKATYLSEEDINHAIEEYFKDVTSKAICYADFLDSISVRSHYGYRVPLHEISQVVAKKKYYEEVAKISNCSFEEVMAFCSGQ